MTYTVSHTTDNRTEHDTLSVTITSSTHSTPPHTITFAPFDLTHNEWTPQTIHTPSDSHVHIGTLFNGGLHTAIEHAETNYHITVRFNQPGF